MNSKMVFCLVRCLSLSYRSLAVSKWRTHSRFCLIDIVSRFATSMLSARCTSVWENSVCRWALYSKIILVSLSLSYSVYGFAVWCRRSFLFFHNGSKNSVHISRCSLVITLGGFLLGCITLSQWRERYPRAIIPGPIRYCCLSAFVISGLWLW